MRVRIPNKKKVAMYLVACLSAILLLSIRMPEQKQQYDIVVLGDSVIGNINPNELAITDYMEDRLEKSVLKGAFGGSTMSAGAYRMWGSNSNNEWSMIKLAEAIASDDWKSQRAAMAYATSFPHISNQALYYFEDTMNALCRVDFSKVEVLIIEHGTNDYNGGKKVDNPDDPYDITTFGGALRRSLQLLQESYPDLRIIVMSPIFCGLGENGEIQGDNTKYGEGGYLKEYVALEQQIAKEFGVEWVDAYYKSGITQENAEVYLDAGLHPNAAGRELLGNLLADYLENNALE